MDRQHGILSHRAMHHAHAHQQGPKAPQELFELAAQTPDDALARLKSAADGLPAEEAAARLKSYGPNRISRERQAPLLLEIWRRFRNPLNLLLLGLAALSWALSDVRSAVVIAIMVLLSVALGFI